MNRRFDILKKLCLFLVFLFLPLQAFGLAIFNTRVDISSILLVCILPILSTKRLFSAFLFCIVVILFTSFGLQFIYQIEVPVSRIVASGGFFSLLLSLMIAPTVITARLIQYMALGLRASFFIFVAGYWLYPFSGNQFGTFTESSFASLYFAAYTACELFEILHSRKLLTFSAIALPASFLFLLRSQGIHVFTMIASLLIIYSFIYLPYHLGSLARAKLPFNVVAITASSLLAFFAILASINSSRIYDRLMSIFNPGDASNLSVIVWVGGASQMLQSLISCPIFGCGAGSPGYFSELSITSLISKFIPVLTVPSYYMHVANSLNAFDAYSLFFRSVVEYGLLAIVLWLWVIKRILFCIQSVLDFDRANYLPALQILIFSLVCIIGSLAKEPNLFSSITFPPVIISVIVCFHICHRLSPPQNTISPLVLFSRP